MSPISTSAFDPTYPTYPVCATLAIVLVLLPAYWQFKARNIGTSLYIIWTVIGNLVCMVNSIVWYGNLEQHSRFWCDLSTKLMIGWSAGLPAASLIINRRLYKIATVQQVGITKDESRKERIIELAIGVGTPIVVMILHVISQGHRYDVIENIGCWPSTYITPVAIATVFSWPILLGLVSAVYASLSIRAFLAQRKAFLSILQSTNSGLNVNRYFRLMALAGTELCFALPFSIYIMAFDVINGMHPWVSWENTHWDFNRTEYVPFGIFALYPQSWILVNVTFYALPAGGYFFFIYLGLSGESGLFWARRWKSLMKFVGLESKVPVVSQQSSWAARPGVSNNSQNYTGPHQIRSIPQHATTSSSAGSSKRRDSLDGFSIQEHGEVKKGRASTDSITFHPVVLPSAEPLSATTQGGSVSDPDEKHGHDMV